MLATPRGFFRMLAVLLPVMAACGCSFTSEFAGDLKLLVLDPALVAENRYPTEQMGVVKGQNCAVRVVGFGSFSQPYQAVNDLRERYGVKVLKRAKLMRHWNQYGFWDQDCWSIIGIGYK